MEKRSNGADPCRPETIGIRQLATEISLGLRSPVTVRAGEMYGGELKMACKARTLTGRKKYSSRLL